MRFHPSITEVINRRAALDKAMRDGKMDSKALTENYAYVYKDGDSPTLGYGRSGARLDNESNDEYTTFIVTTLSEDRDGDIVVPMGWNGENYKRANGPWFFGHQSWEIAIGNSMSPDGRLCCFPEENRMLQRLYWDKHDEDAMFLKGKYDRGVMTATSIAFVPIKAYRRDDVHKAHPADQGPLGHVFEEWDHTETSCVGVGANPGAVRDMLDQEKSFIRPRLQKALGAYADKSKKEQGVCWTGWCPTPQGCVPCEKIISKASHLAPAARDAGKKAAFNDLQNGTQTPNPYAGGENESEWQRSYDKQRADMLRKGGFYAGDKVSFTIGRRSYQATVIPGGSQGYTKVRVDHVEGEGGSLQAGGTTSVQTSALTKKSLKQQKSAGVTKSPLDKWFAIVYSSLDKKQTFTTVVQRRDAGEALAYGRQKYGNRFVKVEGPFDDRQAAAQAKSMSQEKGGKRYNVTVWLTPPPSSKLQEEKAELVFDEDGRVSGRTQINLPMKVEGRIVESIRGGGDGDEVEGNNGWKFTYSIRRKSAGKSMKQTKSARPVNKLRKATPGWDFKVGDRVGVNGQEGTITRILNETFGFDCEIKLDSGKMVQANFYRLQKKSLKKSCSCTACKSHKPCCGKKKSITKDALQDCVSRKVSIFAREHPDWTNEHCVAAAYGYCGEKAMKSLNESSGTAGGYVVEEEHKATASGEPSVGDRVEVMGVGNGKVIAYDGEGMAKVRYDDGSVESHNLEGEATWTGGRWLVKQLIQKANVPVSEIEVGDKIVWRGQVRTVDHVVQGVMIGTIRIHFTDGTISSTISAGMQVERKSLRRKSVDTEYDQGYVAAWDGRARNTNPYRNDTDPKGRNMSEDWDAGWVDGAKERLAGRKSMKKGFKPGDEVVVWAPNGNDIDAEGTVVNSSGGWVEVRENNGRTDEWQESRIELHSDVYGKSSKSSNKGASMASNRKTSKTARRKTKKELDDEKDLTNEGNPAELKDADMDADDMETKDEAFDSEAEEEKEEETPPPPSLEADAMAKMYDHHKSASDYVQMALGGMNSYDPETGEANKAKKALQDHHDKYVAPAMEHMKDLFETHHPDHDLEKMCKGFETDGGSGTDIPTGEANMVDRGYVPDEEEMDLHDDDEELKSQLTDEEKSEVGSAEWAEEEANEPEHKDEDTDEILERYETPKGYRARKASTARVAKVLMAGGEIRRSADGRKWLVVAKHQVRKAAPKVGETWNLDGMDVKITNLNDPIPGAVGYREIRTGMDFWAMNTDFASKGRKKALHHKDLTDQGNPAEIAHPDVPNDAIIKDEASHADAYSRYAAHMHKQGMTPMDYKDFAGDDGVEKAEEPEDLLSSKELTDEGSMDGAGAEMTDMGNPAELKAEDDMEEKAVDEPEDLLPSKSHKKSNGQPSSEFLKIMSERLRKVGMKVGIN